MLRNLNGLKGYAIRALDGDIGHVEDFYFCDKTWLVRYVVVATGNWLTGRTVLLRPPSLRQPDEAAHVLGTTLDREQVATAPHCDTHRPVSRQREAAVESAYAGTFYEPLGPPGYPTDYNALGVLGAVSLEDEPSAEIARENNVTPFDALLIQDDDQDPHLRSANEVEGYHIAARDGDIGRITDFMVDFMVDHEDETWTIRYLVVDTGSWWAGRKVLVAPSWVEWISWDDEKVGVALEREIIQNAPKFDAGIPLDRQYEERLHDHYGRAPYWQHNGY